MTKEVGCDKQGLKAKRPSSLLSSSLPPFLPFSLGGRQRATSARPSGGLLRRAPPGGEEGKSRQRRQQPAAAAADSLFTLMDSP